MTNLRLLRTNSFKRNYRQRIKQYPLLQEAFTESLRLLLADTENISGHSHGLQGSMKGTMSLWVDDDCRVIYRIVEEGILLLDIGSHEEVYRE